MGVVALTVGGVVSGTAPVVNVQTRSLARGLPARSLMPVVRVAVYSVTPASGVECAKVTVVPETVMLPATVGLSRNVAAVTVAESIGSLKVAVIAEESDTPVAPLTGLVAVTVGGVVSGAAPVVKVQTRAAVMGFPAKSLMPVVSVAV